MKILLVLLILFSITPIWSQALDPKPSKPTHLMNTPTPYVNSKNSLVLALHEVSYSLDGNIQLQLSLIESIGHIDFGAKYQLSSDIAVGGGLAGWIGAGHSGLSHIDYGAGKHYHHHSHFGNRLGLFLTGATALGGNFNSAYTLHTQVGSVITMGVDVGGIQQMGSMWSLMLEGGSSLNINDVILSLSFSGAVRIVPPAVPYLYIDLGMTPLSVSMGNQNGLGAAGIFLDVGIALDLD